MSETRTVNNVRILNFFLDDVGRVQITVNDPDLGIFTGQLRSLVLAAHKDRQLPVGMGLVNGVEAVTANVSGCSCSSVC